VRRERRVDDLGDLELAGRDPVEEPRARAEQERDDVELQL
jgi:hypothetical protein